MSQKVKTLAILQDSISHTEEGQTNYHKLSSDFHARTHKINVIKNKTKSPRGGYTEIDSIVINGRWQTLQSKVAMTGHEAGGLLNSVFHQIPQDV